MVNIAVTLMIIMSLWWWHSRSNSNVGRARRLFRCSYFQPILPRHPDFYTLYSSKRWWNQMTYNLAPMMFETKHSFNKTCRHIDSKDSRSKDSQRPTTVRLPFVAIQLPDTSHSISFSFHFLSTQLITMSILIWTLDYYSHFRFSTYHSTNNHLHGEYMLRPE